jgi:hypothetical protein
MISLRKPAVATVISVAICLIPFLAQADSNPNNLPDCDFINGIPADSGLTDAQVLDMYYNPQNYTYLTFCDPTYDFGVILPPNLQALVPVPVSHGTQKYDPLEVTPTPSPNASPSPTPAPAILSASIAPTPSPSSLPDTGTTTNVTLVALTLGLVAALARLRYTKSS